MTSEEAAERIETIKMTLEECIEGEDDVSYITSDDASALDMAIEILEQEPCEDAISKAGVFEILGNLMSIPYDFDRPINKDDVSESMDAIRALSPVTPARPKGHWIGQKKIGFGEWKECIVPLKDGYVTDSCSCSECGEWLTGSDEYQCSGNYCPNCGAEMESEE